MSCSEQTIIRLGIFNDLLVRHAFDCRVINFFGKGDRANASVKVALKSFKIIRKTVVMEYFPNKVGDIEYETL